MCLQCGCIKGCIYDYSHIGEKWEQYEVSVKGRIATDIPPPQPSPASTAHSTFYNLLSVFIHTCTLHYSRVIKCQMMTIAISGDVWKLPKWLCAQPKLYFKGPQRPQSFLTHSKMVKFLSFSLSYIGLYTWYRQLFVHSTWWSFVTRMIRKQLTFL